VIGRLVIPLFNKKDMKMEDLIDNVASEREPCVLIIATTTRGMTNWRCSNPTERNSLYRNVVGLGRAAKLEASQIASLSPRSPSGSLLSY
jgi:hypothetical protein